jgi:hypothetical protein
MPIDVTEPPRESEILEVFVAALEHLHSLYPELATLDAGLAPDDPRADGPAGEEPGDSGEASTPEAEERRERGVAARRSRGDTAKPSSAED